MDPRATSGEQALMNAANGLAEWLRPPKLYVTLAGAAVVLYALVGPKPRSKSNATRRRISR
jgi:hypothetical protein